MPGALLSEDAWPYNLCVMVIVFLLFPFCFPLSWTRHQFHSLILRRSRSLAATQEGRECMVVACVAVVSVSFKPSGASTKDARGHWAKRSKKVGEGWGRKGNACR